MSFAVVASACGSGGGASQDAAVESTGATVEQSGTATDVDVDEDVAPVFGESELAEVEELTAAALELFGSEESAIDAVLLALDAGYDDSQIADAIRTGSLGADGTVPGEPLDPPIDLVLGFRRAAPEPLPVEQLRRSLLEEGEENERLLLLLLVTEGTEARVAENADEDEPGGVSGANGLRVLLALVIFRFPPQAIIESLVLGWEFGAVTCRSEPTRQIGALRVGDTLYPPEWCGGPEQIEEDDGNDPPEQAADADQQGEQKDPSAATDGIEDGIYSGVVDKTSELGQFFSDLEGVAVVDMAEVVVGDGSVTAFELELSGTGASNLNVVTGERLCENPLAITAELDDPGGVVVSGNTAEVPVTVSFVQEVGSGPECFEESNVAIDQTLDDIATIVFSNDTATATLTAGIGATMTRTG